MKVGLFIPCYVDALYPEVGVASYKLLKALGVDVDYPLNQTCCGQPQANAGFESMAVSHAEHFESQKRWKLANPCKTFGGKRQNEEINLVGNI